MLKLEKKLSGEFFYVDCGARGERKKLILDAIPNARYFGFEPDEDECKSLNASALMGYSYFPVAVGEKSKNATLYVTKNPGCSSLLKPNQELFDDFVELAGFFEIQNKYPIDLVCLDEFLPDQNVFDIDFLELDTQGTELDILRGAKDFLSQKIICIRVEVEFQPMFMKQSLFSEIDEYLHEQGFMLFDLERYHVRRKSLSLNIPSKEQIMWGQALYFRDYKHFKADKDMRVNKLAKLALVASYYGFHSFAVEIIDYMLNSDFVSQEATKELIVSKQSYLESLKPSKMIRLVSSLNRPPFSRVLKRFLSLMNRIVDSYQFVTKKRRYFWKD